MPSNDMPSNDMPSNDMPSNEPTARLQVCIVGPGRLGRTMARALAAAGHGVELVGRGIPIPSAPITWLTVPDRSVEAAASAVPPGGVLLHASGARDHEILRPHPRAGSLHPLMSYPGPEVAWPPPARAPAAIAGDPAAIAAARALGEALDMELFEVPGDRRLYHAAAVMAGNFATALLAEAARVLAHAGVPEQDAPALLMPLAVVSLQNAAAVGPARALTGPVARGDEAVLRAHQEALASLPRGTQETYAVLLRATRRLTAPDDAS